MQWTSEHARSMRSFVYLNAEDRKEFIAYVIAQGSKAKDDIDFIKQLKAVHIACHVLERQSTKRRNVPRNTWYLIVTPCPRCESDKREKSYTMSAIDALSFIRGIQRRVDGERITITSTANSYRVMSMDGKIDIEIKHVCNQSGLQRVGRGMSPKLQQWVDEYFAKIDKQQYPDDLRQGEKLRKLTKEEKYADKVKRNRGDMPMQL